MKLKNIILIPLFSICHVSAEVNRDFERRHMHEAHQIEINDEVTFFKIHDLNRDGFWDESELRSMYGSERDVDPNAEHVQRILDKIYEKMDLNRDRLISQDEYITATLPNVPKIETKKNNDASTEASKEKKRSVNSSNKKRSNTSNKPKKQKAAVYIPDKFRA